MQRNHSIDSLKFLCAILVIFIHTPWIYQDAILPITRCAVPCFFMISGYLLFNKKEGIGKERIKRNLRRVFKITLWATIVFIVWKEGINIKSGGYIPSDSELLQWLFLNECPFSGHLWYLYAYIYVLLIVGVVDIYRKWNVLLNLIPLLLLSDLAFGKYSMVLFGKEFPFIYVRNFLFVGLPYFSLGVFLKSIDIFKFLNKNTIRFVRGG